MSTKFNKTGLIDNETRKADSYLTSQLLKHLNPNKNGLYLDVGCGTGNYSNALQGKGFQFVGIDPSIELLQKALSKNQNIKWKVGSAEKTNLPQHSFDGIIATLTIHQWKNLTRAFSELHYILKPEGNIVIFTSTPQQIKGYWLNHYFPKMMEDSMQQMPTLEAIEEAMHTSGIKMTSTETYSVKPNLEDQFLYCGKQNPELYFDDSIRHGIFSFNDLANIKDVKTGLLALKKDIDSGKIDEIIKSYDNDFGDYLYIIGKKTGA